MAAGITDEQMPALFRAADATSLAGQNTFLTAIRVRLAALITAAACGAFVGLMDPPDWVAFVAVVAFLIALGTELYLLFLKPERAWWEGRAAAESVKTLAWRYATGGLPFSIAEPNVDDRFLARLHDMLTDLHDVTLQAGPEGGEQITATMRTLRAASRQERRDVYRVGRIEDQRDWYGRKSAWNDERARQLRFVAIVLEVIGAVAGIMTVIGIVKIDLLGVAAAAVAGVATWMQTKQHETLARSYSVANEELAALRSDWEADRTEDEWARFVDQAEEAISREHTLWRASRGVEARWEKR